MSRRQIYDDRGNRIRHLPRRPGWRVIDDVMHEQILTRQVLAPFQRHRHGPVRLRPALHPLSVLAVAYRKAVEASKKDAS